MRLAPAGRQIIDFVVEISSLAGGAGVGDGLSLKSMVFIRPESHTFSSSRPTWWLDNVTNAMSKTKQG